MLPRLRPLYRLLTWVRLYWLPLCLIPAVLGSLLLPLPLLVSQRFHHDEALYATWALKIVSGQDPWLTNTPIDKPPLYLYILAIAMRVVGVSETAARLPSLAATALTVLLTFGIGRQLYGDRVGVLAAWLVALSPFTLMFAPTAFTDPLLVAFVLASCLAAVHGRPIWAGVFLGLAISTKQQGLFFVPLPLMLLFVGQASGVKCQVSGVRHPGYDIKSYVLPITFYASGFTFHVSRFILALILILFPAFLWDYNRNQPSGFWEQSLTNYGGVGTDTANFIERGRGFINLLWYGTASPLLNLIFLIGCPLLLIYSVWQFRRGIWQAAFDWVFFSFSLAFLLGHALLSFQVWDRYLLGLMPLLALLLARVLNLPWLLWFGRRIEGRTPRVREAWFDLAGNLGLVLLLSLSLARPVQDAINGRYPLGSDSRGLSGIEQIVAYLQGQVGANHTLYHHWLGTHWRFYLWGYPYDLQYWATPAELATKARPGHLIAFPAWRSDTEVRLALFRQGLVLHELARAYTPGGAVSIVLYEIEKRN